MKPEQIILLAGCFAVFIFDALSAIASRKFNFNYARLAPLSFIIFAVIGFVGTQYVNQITGIILAAAVGFLIVLLDGKRPWY